MIEKEWIAPSRTALLLVDCQIDFASPDGAMAKAGHDLSMVAAALRNAAMLADVARAARVPCLFARLITRAGEESQAFREWKARRGVESEPPLCRAGSLGAEFAGPQPLAGEAVFDKSRYSAFAGTGLEAHLREIRRDTLVIAGLTTECCVDSTARDAFERDYHVIIAADAVAAYEPGLHQASLKALELNCALLAPSAEIAAAWEISK
jgi:ureidoacrylate peracid hydrolase